MSGASAASWTPAISHRTVGHSQQPVVVFDDFHPDPGRLRQFATTLSFGTLSPFYPGVQAPMDPRYLGPVEDALVSTIETVFGLPDRLQVVQCSYSMVTTAESDLKPIQRLPHVDTTDGGRLALLHFLSAPEQGGTAFYRHRATGHETLKADDFEAYSRALEREGIPKAGYMRGPDEHFEMIGHIEAKPNRAILYRSHLLHSGFIPESSEFSDDPAAGRLTLNTFFQT